MDLAVNEEFTKMYSEEELLGARRIQVTSPGGICFLTESVARVIPRACNIP